MSLMDTSSVTERELGFGAGAVLLVLLLVYPLVSAGGLLRIFLFTFVWTGLAIAWNMFSGYSGYLSLGHSLFFGGGALVSTMLLEWYGLTPWIGMFVGGFVAAVVAVLFGMALLRLNDIYFALGTVAIPLAIIPVLIWLGIIEVPITFYPDQQTYYMTFRSDVPYYYIGLALLLGTLLVSWQMKRSKIGYYLRAIKGSEDAAQSLGIDTTRYLVYSLAISGFFSGMLGAFYVQVSFVLTPDSVFGFNPVLFSVIIPAVGGVGTVFGPVVGGFFLVPLGEILRAEIGQTIYGIHRFVLGAIVILGIIIFPEGIYSTSRSYLVRRLGGGTNSEATSDAPTGAQTASKEDSD